VGKVPFAVEADHVQDATALVPGHWAKRNRTGKGIKKFDGKRGVPWGEQSLFLTDTVIRPLLVPFFDGEARKGGGAGAPSKKDRGRRGAS